MEAKRIYSKMSDADICIAINKLKTTCTEPFRTESLRLAFKEAKVPMYNEIVTTLIQEKHIVQIGDTFSSGYRWATKEPLIKAVVSNLIKMTRQRVSEVSKKYYAKKKAKEKGLWVDTTKLPKEGEIIEEEYETPHEKLVPVDKAINNAIKLLLNNGYRITKPIIIFEEVTIKSTR